MRKFSKVILYRKKQLSCHMEILKSHVTQKLKTLKSYFTWKVISRKNSEKSFHAKIFNSHLT